MVELVVTNWSCRTSKAAVKLSPPTNQHPTYYRPDALSVPNQQCQCTKGKVSSQDWLAPSSLESSDQY